MRATRKLAVPLLAAAVLATTAEPALAVDGGFRGRYYATWTAIEGQCADDGYAVWIHALGARSRRYDPAGDDPGAVLRYRASETFPWQFTGADGGIALRYRPFTDYARGLAWEAECTWRVQLGRSDPPSD